MMQIRVHILAGAAAGRALLLDRPRLTIGRDATCDVVIDLPYISRTQCELRAEGGAWLLVNHSANGTRLGRRLVTDKPRAVRAGDVVRVGDETIAELTPIDSPASAAPPEAPIAEAKKTSGGQKLWMGIGAYVVVMLGLIIFFATLNERPEQPDALADVRTLTDEQIAAEVRAAVAKRTPLEQKMSENLQLARQHFELREAMPDALYRSHEAYRAAISYAAGDALPDPLDQRRYQLAQEQLIEKVRTAYRSAENLLRARRYDEANAVLAKLRDAYPADRDSAIARSIDELRAAAKRAMGR